MTKITLHKQYRNYKKAVDGKPMAPMASTFTTVVCGGVPHKVRVSPGQLINKDKYCKRHGL